MCVYVCVCMCVCAYVCACVCTRVFPSALMAVSIGQCFSAFPCPGTSTYSGPRVSSSEHAAEVVFRPLTHGWTPAKVTVTLIALNTQFTFSRPEKISTFLLIVFYLEVGRGFSAEPRC